MNTLTEKITAGEKLLTFVQAQQDTLAGNVLVRTIRQRGLEHFASQGLPQRKSEEYKYSPVGLLFKNDLPHPAVKPDSAFNKQELSALAIPGLDSHLITLINGVYVAGLSDVSVEKGLAISTLNETPESAGSVFASHFGKYANTEADPFTALNTAAFRDVLTITIAEKTTLSKPIQILNIVVSDTPALIHPRLLIHVGKQASVQIIENYIYTSKSEEVVSNSLSEIVVGEGARALFYKIQDNCTGLNLISTTQVLQEKDSHFDTHTVTLSGKWIRNNLNIVPDAEHCETHLNGLFLLNGTQHVDNHTLVDHRKPNCESNQLYRGILSDKSTGVFNGKIYVRPDAQKTNAYQSSKNMLLSDEATMNTKPQLEIYADDVKCSHGSSTGQIDEEALFYLRARGISTDSARALLMLAFAKDVVDTIRIDALRNEVEKLIEKRLTN